MSCTFSVQDNIISVHVSIYADTHFGGKASVGTRETRWQIHALLTYAYQGLA